MRSGPKAPVMLMFKRFSVLRDWRQTTNHFRPLQTAAVGFSGVFVNVACMLKFWCVVQLQSSSVNET